MCLSAEGKWNFKNHFFLMVGGRSMKTDLTVALQTLHLSGLYAPQRRHLRPVQHRIMGHSPPPRAAAPLIILFQHTLTLGLSGTADHVTLLRLSFLRRHLFILCCVLDLNSFLFSIKILENSLRVFRTRCRFFSTFSII